MPQNRRFLLVRRPDGMPVGDDFNLETVPTAALAEGQFLIRNDYASLDPAMRGWMDDAPSYMPPIPLGTAVRASTVGAGCGKPGGRLSGWGLGFRAERD